VPAADALGYIEKGLIFRQAGLLADFGILRTYGYPLIVYLYSFVGGFEPLSIALVAGIIQLTVYGLSVLWLASRIWAYSATLARATSIGLLLNPIVVALVADVLTEGVGLIIVVLALVALINSARAQTTAGAVLWAAFGGAVSNFSLMIRPVNLLVLVAWNCGFFLSLYSARRKDVHRAVVLLVYLGTWIVSAAAAWTPQYLYNASFGSRTILPIIPLFDIQVKWGIVLLKYATFVVDEHAEGLLFPNPWCVPPVSDIQPWLWYFEHPIRGMVTIAGHLFSAFNFEYPFVYVYDLDPVYSIPVAGIMWMVTAVGLLNGMKLLRIYLYGKTFSAECTAMIAMISSLFLMVTALNGLITVENRYNLMPIAVLSVLAVHFVISYGAEANCSGQL
jgi:hypothetical protein